MSYIEYAELVSEFARRTQSNLETIRSLQKSNTNLEIYEVTQLINSMLGLLVFPQQSFIEKIPKTPLNEIQKEGWPIPDVSDGYRQVTDLKQLITYLRHAITHCNIKFLPDNDNQILGLELWNEYRNKITWKATVSIADIEKITEKLTALSL